MEFINGGELFNKEQFQDPTYYFFHSSTDKSLAPTLSALVNTNGGSCWIGMTEKRKITGVNPTTELEMLEKLCTSGFTSEISLKVTQYTYKHYYLLLLNINYNKKKIAVLGDLNNSYFIEINHAILIANKIIIRWWSKSVPEVPHPTNYEWFIAQFQSEKICSLSGLYKHSPEKKTEIESMLVYGLENNQLSILNQGGVIHFRLNI